MAVADLYSTVHSGTVLIGLYRLTMVDTGHTLHLVCHGEALSRSCMNRITSSSKGVFDYTGSCKLGALSRVHSSVLLPPYTIDYNLYIGWV